MNCIDGLPKIIRIGPYDIEIRNLPDGDDDCGKFTLGKSELLLQSGMFGVLAVDTFIHELVHAAVSIMGITDDEILEERMACGIGPVFAQVLRDHPEILHWMMDRLTETKSSTTSPTT